MTFRGFFILTTVVSCAFGVAFLFLPEAMSSFYGIPFTPHVAMLDRFFGSALVGLGLFAWVLKDLRDTSLQPRLLIAHAIQDGIGGIVALFATTTHVINAMGWGSVFIYFALVLGCFLIGRTISAARLHVA